MTSTEAIETIPENCGCEEGSCAQCVVLRSQLDDEEGQCPECHAPILDCDAMGECAEAIHWAKE